MEKILHHTALAPFTIYKIGGPARFFVEVKNAGELKDALRYAKDNNLDFFILGAGSNVLISDKGFAGIIIHMTGGEVKVDGQLLLADAGVMMARAAGEAARAELSGLEWAVGIPGTIGGSVRGNAGCFGSEMGQALESVQVLEVKCQMSNVKTTSQNPKIFELSNKECKFSYRHSVFKEHPEWIILRAKFKLIPGDPTAIQERMKAIMLERSSKQDIGTKSCGCIFKNVSWERKDIDKQKLLDRFPELAKFQDQPNIPASFLVDQAGLKGRKIGQVFISPKHANYFVNEGGATADEVVILIALAKDTVFRKFGIALEEEIQYIGF